MCQIAERNAANMTGTKDVGIAAMPVTAICIAAASVAIQWIMLVAAEADWVGVTNVEGRVTPMSKGLGSDLVIFDEAGMLNDEGLAEAGFVHVGALAEDGIEFTDAFDSGGAGDMEWQSGTVGEYKHVVVKLPKAPVDTTPHPSGITNLVAKIDKVISEEKCPHCDRDWHESVLTQRIWQMYKSGKTDPNYFAHEDRSPILCEGSRFIGPIRPKAGFSTAPRNCHVMVAPANPIFNDPFKTLHKTLQGLAEAWETLQIKVDLWMPGYGQLDQFLTPRITPACSDPMIEFGCQNWKYEFRRLPGQKIFSQTDLAPELYQAEHLVHHHWTSFMPSLEVPATRGYDFTKFDTLMPKKYPSTKGPHHEA